MQKELAGDQIKTLPVGNCFPILDSPSSQEIYLVEECNYGYEIKTGQFSLKVKSKLLFQLLLLQQPAQCTLVVIRSFQVSNRNFAKSRLTSKCGGEFS